MKPETRKKIIQNISMAFVALLWMGSIVVVGFMARVAVILFSIGWKAF